MEDEKNKISVVDKSINKGVSLLFSNSNSMTYLGLILIFGFVLRIIAAINLNVVADDMVHTIHAIGFFNSGKLVDYSQSASLWFYITDIFYRAFGVSQLSSRMAALLFGTFSIIAMYLLGKELFNEKIGLLSAFILAVSPYHIKNTVGEMDVTVMFFILLGSIFFIRSLKINKKINFILSGIFIGLAVMIKVYALLFLPSLILFYIYKKYKKDKKIMDKNSLKIIILFLFVIFIFTIPTLTHNYLLYKDKGITDFIFANTLGIINNQTEQLYSFDLGWKAQHDWMGFIFGGNKSYQYPLAIEGLNFILFGDPLIFIFGILGLVYGLYKKDESSIFLFLMILFIFPYLATIILLPKHYTFMPILLTPLAASFIINICENYNRKKRNQENKNSLRLRYLAIAILIFSVIYLGFAPESTMQHVYGKSSTVQFIDFKNNNINNADLIVLDSRIYRGRINWMAYGKPYLEGIDFIEIVNNQDQIPGNYIPIKVYYVECVVDDCGWGTVKDQPEFNQSMEQLTEFFRTNGSLIKSIEEPYKKMPYYPIIYENNRVNDINIYYKIIYLKPQTLLLAVQPKNWFHYNIGHFPKGGEFDDYSVRSLFDRILDKFAHLIIYISIILAFLSVIFLIYLLFKKK